MRTRLLDLMQSVMELEPQDPAARECVWRPAVDVYRCRGHWLVKVDLAGVRPQDIQLGVRQDCLTIRGVRRDWALEEGRRSYSMEIAYNRFQRTIRLPADLESARIATDYRDGMLLIRLEMEGT